MELRIKDVLKAKGYSIQSLADKMGINRVNLSSSINGNPTVETLQKIATALGVEVWELFTASTNKGNLCGFIKYRNNIYEIDSLEKLRNLLREVEADQPAG